MQLRDNNASSVNCERLNVALMTFVFFVAHILHPGIHGDITLRFAKTLHYESVSIPIKSREKRFFVSLVYATFYVLTLFILTFLFFKNVVNSE